MPSVIWCSSFDYGTTVGMTVGTAGSKIFDAVSTPAVTTTSPHTGTYALNLTGTTAIRSVTLTSSTLGGPAALVASFWVKFPTSLPSNSPDLCCFSTNGNDGFMFYQAAGTKLGVAWAGGSTFDGPVVVADTWYHIDMLVDATSNPHSLSWRVNGVAQTGTTTAFAAGTVSSWALGRVDAVTGTYHFDDAVVSNAAADYPLGEHKVILLTPDQSATLTVNGSTANWNTFADATPTLTAWSEPTARAAIDDIPLLVGASQDGIAQIARTDSTHYVEIPMTSYTLAGGESISAVQMLASGWAATTAAATFGFRSYNGTTETVLQAGSVDPNFDNSSTPPWVRTMLTLADVNTQAELDALAFRIGFSTDVSPNIGIHAIFAEVAVKTSSGTTYNQSVSGSTTPTGALIRATSRAVAGSTTPTGVPARATSRSLASSTTPTGTASRALGRSLAGSTTPAGAVTRTLARLLAGVTTPTGEASRAMARALSGTTSPTGLVVRALARILGGSATPTGSTARATSRELTGSTAPTGAVAKATARSVAGSMMPTGSVSRAIARTLGGGITPAGLINRALARLLGGSTAPTGTLANDAPSPPSFSLTLGPPQSAWHASAPRTSWGAEPPGTTWTARPPRGG